MLVAGLAIALLSAGIIFGAMFLLKKQVATAAGAERESYIKQIPEILAQVENELQKSTSFGSRLQLQRVSELHSTCQADLEKEKEDLKQIETRLDESQKKVEAKESAQQEIKTSREEDDNRLQELMERYGEISQQAMSLEQQLAVSLETLDGLMKEVELTPKQQGVFEELVNALTAAGGRLRDLLTESAAVNERLEQLKQQHKDLEEEYTRLVEQQLGE